MDNQQMAQLAQKQKMDRQIESIKAFSKLMGIDDIDSGAMKFVESGLARIWARWYDLNPGM